MNFYKHHLGDYSKATSHLSFVEDAAYSKLLRKYYSKEKPIPGALNAAQRLVGARARHERMAVETVLKEFFQYDGERNVWRNKRADEEISKANAQAETNRRIAEEREASRRRRNEVDDRVVSSGEMGKSFNELGTNREPSQTPDSISHISKTGKPEHSHASALLEVSTEAGRACALLRQAGCRRVNPSNPKLLAALNEGVTPETIRDTYLERPDAAAPFAWAIATARNRQAQCATEETVPTPTRVTGAAPMSKTLQALHELEAHKNGTRVDQAGNRLRITEVGSA
ncbi:YdaU family protein [Dyella japonica]|uniref:YdaU family protein n=1 Tax=Dyella japonica TaxID=231455 RepID=UPI00069C2CD1|nr:YdaU family protein [Dyella japonica]